MCIKTELTEDSGYDGCLTFPTRSFVSCIARDKLVKNFCYYDVILQAVREATIGFTVSDYLFA